MGALQNVSECFIVERTVWASRVVIAVVEVSAAVCWQDSVDEFNEVGLGYLGSAKCPLEGCPVDVVELVVSPFMFVLEVFLERWIVGCSSDIGFVMARDRASREME